MVVSLPEPSLIGVHRRGTARRRSQGRRTPGAPPRWCCAWPRRTPPGGHRGIQAEAPRRAGPPWKQFLTAQAHTILGVRLLHGRHRVPQTDLRAVSLAGVFSPTQPSTALRSRSAWPLRWPYSSIRSQGRHIPTWRPSAIGSPVDLIAYVSPEAFQYFCEHRARVPRWPVAYTASAGTSDPGSHAGGSRPRT